MKRMGRAGFMGLMVIFLSVLTIGGWAGNAAAVTIGTMTGSGTVTVDDFGQPTAYSFSGSFAFDNVTQYNVPGYGLQTLAQIMGDQGQYVFLANSSGNLPAYDYSGVLASPPPGYTTGSNYIGTFQYDLNTTGNGGEHSSTFYGSVVNFVFQGSEPTGTVTAAVQSSDGYIHWYYGFDNFAGPPAGETSLASLGLSDTSYFNGTYTVTGYGDHSVNYTLTGTFDTVPLPSTVLLLGSGLMGLVGLRYRRKLKG